ncbi:MAG: aminopeptidase P family protein [Rubricoccaceae bacterium]
MSDRVSILRQLADANDAEAILVTHPPDLRWALGFTGSNGLLVVHPHDAVFVTDGRYTEQARQQVGSVPTEIASSGLAEHVAASKRLQGVGRAVVASDHLTVATFDTMRTALDGTQIVPIPQLLSTVVAEKSEAEIEGVRTAQAVTAEVFEAVLPFVRAGVSERDIAAEIVYQHLKRGAEAMSFEPIVAAGARGALPHARPSEHVLAEGDLVVMDMGGIVDGLCSDMTRTVAVGDPGEEAREAYAVVLEAQQAAIEAARAGMTGKDLDRVARDVIETAGLGDAFSHSLGHGVGYEVHEWPRLSQHVEHVLPVGATVTIEPGVYLPGRFGIRIEDILVLREGGAENLTTPTKKLLIL